MESLCIVFQKYILPQGFSLNLVLNLFLNFHKISGSCSYIIVLIKKRVQPKYLEKHACLYHACMGRKLFHTGVDIFVEFPNRSSLTVFLLYSIYSDGRFFRVTPASHQICIHLVWGRWSTMYFNNFSSSFVLKKF